MLTDWDLRLLTHEHRWLELFYQFFLAIGPSSVLCRRELPPNQLHCAFSRLSSAKNRKIGVIFQVIGLGLGRQQLGRPMTWQSPSTDWPVVCICICSILKSMKLSHHTPANEKYVELLTLLKHWDSSINLLTSFADIDCSSFDFCRNFSLLTYWFLLIWLSLMTQSRSELLLSFFQFLTGFVLHDLVPHVFPEETS